MNLWICLARVSDEMGGGGRRMNVELSTYRMSHQHTSVKGQNGFHLL